MNNSDRKERASLLGSTQTTTYAAQAKAQASLDQAGGRFAVEDKSVTSGSEASVTYPTLPPSSPWSGPRLPDEPPLGFAVGQMEPVGTHAEIEASLKSLGSAGLITSAEESEATLRPVAVAAPGVGGVNSLASPTPDPATHAKLAQIVPRLIVKKWSPPKW